MVAEGIPVAALLLAGNTSGSAVVSSVAWGILAVHRQIVHSASGALGDRTSLGLAVVGSKMFVAVGVVVEEVATMEPS